MKLSALLWISPRGVSTIIARTGVSKASLAGSRTSRSAFSNFFEKQTIVFAVSNMKPATLRPFLPRPAIRRRICITRSYAVQAPGTPTLQIFDRHTKYLQKERAAANVERSRQVDYLKDEVAMRLSERLLVSFNTPIEA
jgi:hypothetical protein